jgi:tubulin polyglutamylase TTLL4
MPKNKKVLVQKYIADPYTIDGRKFDFRIYILVTGVDPMRIYIFNEGLTRISTNKYSLKTLDDRFAHLTNYSVNKKSSVFKAATEAGADEVDPTGETEGFKWSLPAFKRWLAQQTSPQVVEATFKRVEDMLIKTMLAAESTITPQLHSIANYRT